MVRDEKLIEIAKESYSVSDVMRRLDLIPMGGNHKNYKERLKKLGITKFKKRPVIFREKRLLREYLVLNGPNIISSKLRVKLLRGGLKKEECEKCGQGPIWHGESLNLHLDHVDGNRKNNQIENLMILCPNCHSQTPTYGALKEKSKAKETAYIRAKKNGGRKCPCGKRIYKRNKTGLCRKCYIIKFPPFRKVSNRPRTDILLAEVKELGYSGTGRKYDVSDNAVRKWVKQVLPPGGKLE